MATSTSAPIKKGRTPPPPQKDTTIGGVKFLFNVYERSADAERYAGYGNLLMAYNPLGDRTSTKME